MVPVVSATPSHVSEYNNVLQRCVAHTTSFLSVAFLRLWFAQRTPHTKNIPEVVADIPAFIPIG